MSRIPPVDPATAQQALGVTPNLFRVTAQSPAALEGLLGLNGALQRGKLPAKLREQIALRVAEKNRCDYCLSAHTVLGKHAGLAESDITAAREARAGDAKTAAALHFVSTVLAQAGGVSDADLASVRHAGYADGEIVEMVALIALNILTNYLNRVAATDIDFPVVRARVANAA
jgi:AhpD family alkylhydroperoxidase